MAGLFWDLRRRLWPAVRRSAPLVRSDDDAADRALEKMLQEAGINSASVRREGYGGLADIPRLDALEPLLGRDYAPYRELRSVWIPFAAHAASVYEDTPRPSATPFIEALKAIRHLRDSSRMQGDGALHKAWHGSPFRTIASDPVMLAVQIDTVFDELFAGSTTYVPFEAQKEASVRLEKTLTAHDAAKRRINVDVAINTFIDVLAFGFF